MKRLLLAFGILLCASVASAWQYAPPPAPGEWFPLGGDRYQGSTYIWRAWYNCGWQYEIVKPVVIVPAIGSPTFWQDAEKNEYKAEESRSQKDFLERRFQVGDSPGGTGYESSGFTIRQQGIAPGLVQGGNTLQGYTDEYANPDWMAQAQQLINENLRRDEMVNEGNQKQNLYTTAAIQQFGDRAERLNNVRVAARGYVETLKAMQAPPEQTISAWQKKPAQSPQQQAAPYRSSQARPPAPVEMIGCVKCHNGVNSKAVNFNLEALAQLSTDNRDQLASEALRRQQLPETEPEFMPRGGKKNPEDKALKIAETIAGHAAHRAPAGTQQYDDHGVGTPQGSPLPPPPTPAEQSGY